MPRLFLSSLALVAAFLSKADAQDVVAFGTSWNIENRENAADGWSFIPNYAYPGCDAYITYSSTSPYYKSVQPTYNPAGFSNTPLYYSNTANPATPNAQGACCGPATDASGNAIWVYVYGSTFVRRQACGPDLWPFSAEAQFGGADPTKNAIQRCINIEPNQPGGNPSSGQQTPIDIRTIASLPVNSTTGEVLSPGIPATPLTNIGFNTGLVNQTGLTFNAQFGSIIPVFTGGPCPATFAPSAGTWQMDFDPSACNLEVQVGTQKFRLVQFHFHNSEHTINGLYHPIEVHYVHVGLTGGQPDIAKPLVLGAFLTTGTYKNFFLERLITNFNNPTTRLKTISINPYELIIPVKTSYWHYKGSLTTPPCQTRDGAFVRWFLFKKPIVVSWQQAQFLSQYFNDLKKSYNAQNNRPVNAILDSTKVYSYGPNPWP